MVLSKEPLELSGITAGCDQGTPPELGHLAGLSPRFSTTDN